MRVNVQQLRDLGHACVLFDCSNGGFVVVCRVCKGYTSGARVATLSKLCPGRRESKYNPDSWNKICKGLHPKDKFEEFYFPNKSKNIEHLAMGEP